MRFRIAAVVFIVVGLLLCPLATTKVKSVDFTRL